MAATSSADLYLGVDGGGTKTEFVLITALGEILARYQAGTSGYLQVGDQGVRNVLSEGVTAVLSHAGVAADAIAYAFLGLPTYGENPVVQARLDAVPEEVLGHRRYVCGNDMVCGWAGSLACADGINIVAGTGSIGYGERLGASARSGGWCELFSDEGSAYWIAVQGLNVFSRMSDGRTPKGPLYDLIRAHFALKLDLDLCGHLTGDGAQRSAVASLSKLVSQAADEGDAAAAHIFARAGEELAQIVDSLRVRLGFGDETVLVSYSGGVFRSGARILAPLYHGLENRFDRYRLVEPILTPGVGAALYAARASGRTLHPKALAQLKAQDTQRA